MQAFFRKNLRKKSNRLAADLLGTRKARIMNDLR